MSHFAVLVIGQNVKEQLQPYHEFECTGIDDEYVIEIDRTEEALAEFASAAVSRLKSPDGALHTMFNDKGEWKPEFSQLAGDTDWDKTRRKLFVPPGFEEVEVPANSVETAAEWISEYYGWPIAGKGPGDEFKYGRIELDAEGNVTKCVDRTNPNKAWDWWVTGGRWSGWLKTHKGTADEARKSEIDFEGMRNAAADTAATDWDKAASVTNGIPWKSWKSVRESSITIDEARAEYNGQSQVIALDKLFDHPSHDKDQYLTPRDQFIQQARDGATTLYAVVMDGKWIAKGKMGWFGMSNDAIEQQDWDRRVNEMLDQLPDDTLITVVDCHI